MKPTLTHPTWNQIDQGCSYITFQLYQRLQHMVEPTLLIGLVRGGAIPTVRISNLFNNTPVLLVNYSSKSGRGDNKNHHNQLDVSLLKGHQHVCLIDDIVDSGETMREFKELVQQHCSDVTVAALYAKEDSVLQPDIVWQTIPSDSPWILFPWEL